MLFGVLRIPLPFAYHGVTWHPTNVPAKAYVDVGEFTLHDPISEGHVTSGDMTLVIKGHDN